MAAEDIETGLLQCATDTDHAWMVVHVRPRCEKKLAEFCLQRQIDHYLPLLERHHQYGGRRRINQLPLFPGYLFVLADRAGLDLLRQNQRVANVLHVLDQQKMIDQLNQIKRVLDQKRAIELFPHMSEGMLVMVRQGPLKGVEGRIYKMKSQTRIILSVDIIQQAVSVEVDAAWLVPV